MISSKGYSMCSICAKHTPEPVTPIYSSRPFERLVVDYTFLVEGKIFVWQHLLIISLRGLWVFVSKQKTQINITIL